MKDLFRAPHEASIDEMVEALLRSVEEKPPGLRRHLRSIVLLDQRGDGNGGGEAPKVKVHEELTKEWEGTIALECAKKAVGKLRHAEATTKQDFLSHFHHYYDNRLVAYGRAGATYRKRASAYFGWAVQPILNGDAEARRLCESEVDRTAAHGDAYLTLEKKIDEPDFVFTSGVRPFFRTIYIGKCKNLRRKNNGYWKMLGTFREYVKGLPVSITKYLTIEDDLIIAEQHERYKKFSPACYDLLWKARYEGGYHYQDLVPEYGPTAGAVKMAAKRCRDKFVEFTKRSREIRSQK